MNNHLPSLGGSSTNPRMVIHQKSVLQKWNLVLLGPAWPCLAPFGPIWPSLTPFYPLLPLLTTFKLHFSLFNLVRPFLTLFGKLLARLMYKTYACAKLKEMSNLFFFATFCTNLCLFFYMGLIIWISYLLLIPL